MYETEKLWVSSIRNRVTVANEMAEEFAWHARLNARDSMHVCLLVEETLGMVRSIADDFDGQMWLEGDDTAFRLHLNASAKLDGEMKRRLVAASTDGKNAAPRGFMAKIGAMLFDAFAAGEAAGLAGPPVESAPAYMSYGMGGSFHGPLLSHAWSLNVYRETLREEKRKDPTAEDALDELEKSIVARLADDVVVSARGRRIELVIEKRFRH